MPTAGLDGLDGHGQNAIRDDRDVDSRTPLLKNSLPTPTLVSQKTALLFQNWWLWEILSAGTAVSAIILIIAILILFDQSSLPDWPSVFTVDFSASLILHLLLRQLRR